MLYEDDETCADCTEGDPELTGMAIATLVMVCGILIVFASYVYG